MSAVTSDAQRFATILEEWRPIQRRRVRSISDWEGMLLLIAEDETRLRDRGAWRHGPDDYLGVLGRSRDELVHSAMVAWLLDPCGKHGLGTAVLGGVLSSAFGVETVTANLGRARTSCEVPLDEGRLDIVVEAPGLYLVIENKVDAEESDRQCQYYFDHVLRRDKQFILLSPDGREAVQSSPEAREAFKPLSYPQLREVIRQALRTPPPYGPGRAIVEEYVRTLEKEFR
jgi:hypothetical protein